jgi:hypothetical protein
MRAAARSGHFFHSNYDANVDGHAILLPCLGWSFELQKQNRSRFNHALIPSMRPQQALESMNRHDDIAPSPVMVAACSSRSALALEEALCGILRVGDRQSFARLQSELLALVQTTLSATSSPDRPNDDEEETNHNNNNAAAAAVTVWFEPDPVSGWTFLHYCASTDDMPTRHWERLLQHCPVGPVIDDRTATTTPSPWPWAKPSWIFFCNTAWGNSSGKATSPRPALRDWSRYWRTAITPSWLPPPSTCTSTTGTDAGQLLFHVAVLEGDQNVAWSDDAGYLSSTTTIAFHEDVRSVRTFLRDFCLLLKKNVSSHGNIARRMN